MVVSAHIHLPVDNRGRACPSHAADERTDMAGLLNCNHGLAAGARVYIELTRVNP